MITKLMASPAFVYLKLIAIGAAIAGAAYIAWDYRGAKAEQDKAEAVADAIKQTNDAAQKEIEKEREWRAAYMKRSDDNLKLLLADIASIRKTQEKFQADVRDEIAKSPAFYNQPLPEGGFQIWSNARSRLQSPQQ